jgi:hypothetical protein
MPNIGISTPPRRQIARLGAAVAVIALVAAARPEFGAGHEAMGFRGGDE